MQISENGILLIQRFEGLRLHRYLDSVGVPTIGFGTTAAALGRPVPATCTLAQAEAWLRNTMQNTYAAPLNKLIANGLEINQNQYDPLCSLSYNEGPGILSNTAVYSMARDLANHNLSACSADFMHYTTAGGRVLGGLVTRREAERALFDKPVPKPPPPPNPLAILPTNVGDKSLPNSGNERLTYQQAHGALEHPAKFRGYLKGKLYYDLKEYRDRLSRLSQYEPPSYTKKRPEADWKTNSRGARWQMLNNLMKKISKL